MKTSLTVLLSVVSAIAFLATKSWANEGLLLPSFDKKVPVEKIEWIDLGVGSIPKEEQVSGAYIVSIHLDALNPFATEHQAKQVKILQRLYERKGFLITPLVITFYDPEAFDKQSIVDLKSSVKFEAKKPVYVGFLRQKGEIDWENWKPESEPAIYPALFLYNPEKGSLSYVGGGVKRTEELVLELMKK